MEKKLFSGEPRSFADHGFEKMLYDARMGPVSIVHKDVLYVSWGGDTETSLPQPNLITYDIKAGVWSKPVRPAQLEALSPDHHFNPVLWMDNQDRLHMLYQTHCSAGIHIYTPEAGNLEKWVRGPQIAPNITYPRIFKLPDGRILMFYRVLSHMGFWTYIVSNDGGFSWSKPVPLIDFDQNAVFNDDDWAGSYHSAVLSKDGKSLHLGFVYFHERGMYSWIHPLYKKKTTVQTRFHMYYVKVDIDSGRMTDIDGNVLPRPLNKNQADACQLVNTGLLLTNIPTMLLDEWDNPSFLYVMSTEEAMDKCYFHYLHRKDGQWINTVIRDTNNTWSGSCLYRDAEGKLNALLSGLNVEGTGLLYGGGSVERWTSHDDGDSWEFGETVDPVPGLLYNNPQYPHFADGTGEDKRFLLLFGWEGPGSLTVKPVGPTDYNSGERGKSTCRAFAYAAMNGKWI